MGFLEGLFKGLQDFAESDTAKRMLEQAEQRRVDEINKTTGRNGLRCKIDSLDDYGYQVCCKGSVKNIGRSTYCKITIEVAFKNEYGDIVDKKKDSLLFWGITLAPEESMPFETISRASDIHSAGVSISSFEESDNAWI